jgi:hypothetical protein
MIVVTAQPQENGIENYLNRWPIETLFSCLKGRGFRLEDTRILQRRKIKKVIALLALSYAWAIKIGLWRHRYEKIIRLKKHGRKAISFFRYGLDFLQDAVFKLMHRLLRGFIKALNILFPPGTKSLSAVSDVSAQ